MRQFLARIFLFNLPMVLLFSFPIVLFFLSGEFLPMATVVNHQKNFKDSLYLSGVVSFNDRPYKLISTITKDPEIIVFGTSRTLTMQSRFFKDKNLFYNAGYNAGQTLRVGDLITFIDSIPNESNLKVIMFDASSFLAASTKGESIENNRYQLFHTFITSTWRNLYLDYFRGRFSLRQFSDASQTANNIGIDAILYDRGYREDGSVERNIQEDLKGLNATVMKNIESELKFIIPGHGGFSDYSDTIPVENIETIEEFLRRCKAKNIYVIGYLSPYALELHQKMNSLQDGYGNSYRTAPVILSEIFKKEGFNFYDIRDLKTIGSSNEELYDSHHSTEKGTLKLLLFLLDHENILKQYLEKKDILQQIKKEAF